MNVNEFSNEFEVLLNSYIVSSPFGLTNNPVSIEISEYEKSVLLTKAQEELVLELYNGKNPFRESLESTEEVRKYLEDLIETSILDTQETTGKGIDSRSVFYRLPEEVWFITYETATITGESLCGNTVQALVVPVTQDEFYHTIKNPFRKPNRNKVLRLDNADNIVELISEYPITKYLVRYLKKPTPIILTNLPDDLTIHGINTISECALHSGIHYQILDRAVRMALYNKGILGNSNKEQPSN